MIALSHLGRALGLGLVLGLSVWAARAETPELDILAGMPPVVDRTNLYSEIASGLSPAAAEALPRVYVPNLRSNDVYVIDPATLKVLNRFPVGRHAQHVVPAYDLKTLWVTSVGARTCANLML